MAAIGDITNFTSPRQLRKILGWYPEAKESGTTVSKRRLGMSGNRIARRELWLWALQLSSSQYATPFHAYYRRLWERRMPGMIAIGHVAGKLITIIFHCVRNGQQYDAANHAADLGLADEAWRHSGSNMN